MQDLAQNSISHGARNLPKVKRFWQSLSATGLLFGTLFMAVSLTPSLAPHPFLFQALLSGVAFAIGYGAGVLARWMWGCMEVPVPGSDFSRILNQHTAPDRFAAGWGPMRIVYLISMPGVR